jgi:Amt family ammonium transporter
MPPRFRSGHEASTLATFDRLRVNFFAGVQQLQLRRYGMGLMAAGAGLLPLMAGSAHAALTKMPTDGADTLLMLFGSALVLLMTPGLAFFYGGFTRSKNVLNTMMMSFFLMGLIGVLWVVVGYSLAFGTGFKSPFCCDRRSGGYAFVSNRSAPLG